MNNKQILKNAPHGTYHYYPKSDVYLDDICCGYWSGEKKRFLQAQPEGEVRSLKDISEIVELKKLLSKIRDDLLIRSDERDSEGRVVVNLSSSIWNKLNEVIDSDG